MAILGIIEGKPRILKRSRNSNQSFFLQWSPSARALIMQTSNRYALWPSSRDISSSPVTMLTQSTVKRPDFTGRRGHYKEKHLI